MQELDYLFFYHHVIMGYEKTMAGLRYAYQNGLITAQELADATFAAFERYQEKREDFARKRWGEKWQEHLKSLDVGFSASLPQLPQ